MSSHTDINLFNKISPEQRLAEEQCMKQLEMMEARLFSLEMDRQARKLAEEEPRLKYMSITEIIQEDEMRRATCELCGTLCKSEAHKIQHRGFLACRKKQADNKGETYIPEDKRPVHCEICNKTVQQRRWKYHTDSKMHKMNVIKKDGRAFHCAICDYTGKGGRAKRMLKNHCEKWGHLKKLNNPPMNRAAHDAICELHGFKIKTDELIEKFKKAKIKVV